MAIDRPRYDRWKADLKALVERLPADDLAATVKAKILDLIRREVARDADLSIREIRQLVGDLLDADLEGYARAIVDTYERIVEITNDHYADLGLDVGRDFDLVRAIERANALDIGKYSEGTISRVARQVREALAGDEDVEQLIERIRPIDQKTEFYARAIGETVIKRHARGLKSEKARRAEVEIFQYVGVVRPTTRPFCRTHAGRTYTLEQIRSLKNGNLEPVLENGGGWRCVHDWEPDPFATDSDDVATAPPA